MSWIIGILAFVLVVDCLLLILLVLVQLPKKEAGMGQAFGGGATDALFGAGSGNALTKMTKYATGIFFILTLSLSVLYAQKAKNRSTDFEEKFQKAELPPVAAPASPTNVPAPLVSATNTAAAKPATNPPATPPVEKGK